jgi:hypothetical protein
MNNNSFNLNNNIINLISVMISLKHFPIKKIELYVDVKERLKIFLCEGENSSNVSQRKKVSILMNTGKSWLYYYCSKKKE